MTLPLAVERAFAPARDSIAAGRIPGAVLAAATRDGARALVFAGAAQIVPERVAMRADSVFDLASLTKVVFTTTAILRLVESGAIGLDDPLIRAIPDLRQYDMQAAERRLTFRACLAHQTFLPHVEPIYAYGLDPQTARAFVLQREWRQGPPVYSDINFMLLGIAVERLTGRLLEQQPLPPGFAWRPDPARCVATEACTWRGRVMRGEVHDENAFAFGGPCGHAGLFGTADALLDFGLALLDGRALSHASLEAILTPQSATRLLGWERPHAGWHGGAGWSSRTMGHTGFTGVAFYVDVARGRVAALLTNRVHPSRHADSGILALRQATCDALNAGWPA